MFDKRMTLSYGYWSLIGLCWLLQMWRAENTYGQTFDTLRTKNLRPIEIRHLPQQRIFQSTVPLQILTSADLQRINGLSVAEAIRYFSGMQLKDYGGIGGLKTVNVRSMGSQHTSVFYDGIALSNAQNGQVDLGKYSLDQLEEISLTQGQNDAFLLPAKSYASASSIHLKTRTPVFEKGEKQHLKVALKGGSFGLLHPGMYIEQQLNEKMSLRAGVAYLYADGRYAFRYSNGSYDTTAVRNNGDVRRLRVEAAAFGTGKEGWKWQMQWHSFLSERGLPGAIVANKFDYSQRIWDENHFAQGSLSKFQEKGLSWNFQGKLAYDRVRFVDPEYITINGFLDNRFHEKEGYLSASLSKPLSADLKLSYAGDYQFQTLDANLYRFAYPKRHLFLNVVNAHYQSPSITFQASVLSTTLLDRVKIYQSAGDKQLFSPSFSFSWQPMHARAFRLRAFYKDIFRMPTFNDLYYTFIGNTLLKPEFARQYNVGFSYMGTGKTDIVSPLSLQVDAYYNEVTDKIVAQPGANLIRWIMYNIGKVEIKGLDANLKYAIQWKSFVLRTGIQYTYQQAVDVTTPGDDYYRHQIPYIPRYSGSFVSGVDIGAMKFNYSFIYTGSRYNQKANILYNYMEPWYTHDVAWSYRPVKKLSNWSFQLEVNNLLNQFYDVIPNFPMPGRHYRFTLNYQL